MNRIPLSLIIDDPAPRMSVYYDHIRPPLTEDGRPLLREVPNQFMSDFCEVIERHGLRGKFSVIPMPCGHGDIVNGITGFDRAEVDEWLDAARTRVAALFSICPEMLTHAGAVDLGTGAILDINESDWSHTQTAATLTPYIARALELLHAAGLPVSGLTSPWSFGMAVEDEYVAAIAAAFDQVLGIRDSWYFLHCLSGHKGIRPWLALDRDGRRVVSIPATVYDHIWQTIDTPDDSPEYISRVADGLITADGTAGEIVDVLAGGGWPVVLTHWQALFSNGLCTGLKVLDEVAQRVARNLGDRVEWMSSEQLMRLVLADPDSFPRPAL